ncbi:MAG TPA: hypothetical protein PLB01_15335 [Thermoanaerobaculia bacterium]|nr:hypothetical protein [Thermoanaerobaculia bacterium]
MMNDTTTACPWLKQVVMLYCDACPTKKMVPRDQLVSMGPCLAGSFSECAMYREMVQRLEAGAARNDDETEASLAAASGREVPS